MTKQNPTFPGQYKNEKVVLFLRRHWVILSMKIVKLVLILVAFGIAYLVIANFFPGILDADYYPLIVLFLYTLALTLWAYFFEVWNDYYLDIWIVTDQRIINIEQEGLFKRISSEQKIYRIQDITTDISGFLPTLVDYGSVHIQTAGTKERFNFEQVSNPSEVKQTILSLHDKYLEKYGDKMLAAEQRADVAEIEHAKEKSNKDQKLGMDS